MRPSAMTAMRDAMLIASSWSWVTIRKVMPTRCWMRTSSKRVSSRSLRSSAASGSSSSTSFGSLRQRAGERHALALAARELVRLATGERESLTRSSMAATRASITARGSRS